MHRADFGDAAVAVVRNHRADAARRRAAGGTDEQEELHQVVVHLGVRKAEEEHGRTRRLHDEDLLATHVAVQTDLDLAVVEAVHYGVLKIDTEITADRLRELAVSASREDPK